ncbi:MAG TPA: hypothetical protein VMZ66_06260 [Aeromicrobium sp.]|nr:hypothetical protein [Aeromicrobium sp.]
MGEEVEHVARRDVGRVFVDDAEEGLQVEGDRPHRVGSCPPGDELQVAVEQRMAELDRTSPAAVDEQTRHVRKVICAGFQP